MKNGTFYLKRALLLGSAMASLAACQSLSQGDSTGQMNYETPEMAVNSLVQANRDGDQAKLVEVLGPGSEQLIASGDPVADEQGRQKFVTAYDSYHRLDAVSADKQILVIGGEEWPLPIPVVRGSNGWVWDTAEGEQAILDRRIGRNELNVIQICREYVDAQQEYAAMRKKYTGHAEYAQRITSTAGKHDGLYWPAKKHHAQSPFGPLMADAQAEGYDRISGHHAPYHGYYFRVLKAQGPAAGGGEKEYVTGDHMTQGFALIAYPASYGDSGVKTFIVNQNGIVYQNDLGSDTANVAPHIEKYNPDEDWQPVR